jgi:TolA-binding protein
MDTTITLTWTQLLIALAAVAAVYVIELLFFMRQSRRLQAAPADPLTLKLEAELNAVTERVGNLNARVDELRREIDQLRRSPATSGQYREALELAQGGADAATVASGCGLSRGEAELIVALQRMRPE